MEKFMYLFRRGDDLDLSPEACQANDQKWGKWIHTLVQKDVFVNGEPLHHQAEQVDRLEETLSHCPLSETKETIVGYVVVNARDIEEAIEISRDCPVFETGGNIEVRQLRRLEI